MKERLQYIINNEGVSNLKFAEMLGVNPASISHILTERNKPSFDFVVKIAEKLPHYNLRWLLTGNGEPLEPTAPPEVYAATPNNAPIPDSQPQTNQEEDIKQNDTTTPKAEEQAVNHTTTTSEKLIICFPDGTFSEFTKR